MGKPVNSTARLRWRCRRGTREMDLLLQRFLELHYPRLNTVEQTLFKDLLEEADPDIYAWITGRTVPDNPGYLALIGKISSNGDKGAIPALPEGEGRGEGT